MSDYPTSYFRAAGRSLAAIEKWLGARKAAHAEAKEFAARFDGATDLYYTPCSCHATHIVGLVFEGDPPLNWKRRKGEKFCIPDRRRKSGKLIERAMLKLGEPPLGPDACGERIIGRRLYTSGIRLLSGNWFIAQHSEIKPPADAIPIKASEFWQLVEVEQAAKPAASETAA